MARLVVTHQITPGEKLGTEARGVPARASRDGLRRCGRHDGLGSD
jgi:hypothetical protein